MYHTILITLDTTEADQTILAHIRPLASQFHSRLVLLHVADGWAARLHGPDAVSREITEDRAYLAKVQADLEAEGFAVETHLAYGDPANEIIKWVQSEHCDLIAMSTHGHRFLADIILGATAHKVQHQVDVPVLLVRMGS
jgi:nucleotide-binding universal stress UspA family protein